MGQVQRRNGLHRGIGKLSQAPSANCRVCGKHIDRMELAAYGSGDKGGQLRNSKLVRERARVLEKCRDVEK